jgi:hypothetical protein
VVTYEGLCEQFKYQKADNPTASPLDTRVRDPRLKPWLKATPTTMATPQEKFKQQFFVANRTGGVVVLRVLTGRWMSGGRWCAILPSATGSDTCVKCKCQIVGAGAARQGDSAGVVRLGDA